MCCGSTRRTSASTSVPNVCGVIITTNHKTDGIYLPADDRRHYVAWSNADQGATSPPTYWDTLCGWYRDGGSGHVAAYLAASDLAAFDPKAPPPQTDAFQPIVALGRPTESDEMTDALTVMKSPRGRHPRRHRRRPSTAAPSSGTSGLGSRTARTAAPSPIAWPMPAMRPSTTPMRRRAGAGPSPAVNGSSTRALPSAELSATTPCANALAKRD